jgi:protein-histidine N-methyltransferase
MVLKREAVAEIRLLTALLFCRVNFHPKIDLHVHTFLSMNTFKMSAFRFSFSGDDIEDSSLSDPYPVQTFPSTNHAAETGILRRASSSAFPIAGQPLLPPQIHDLEAMLKVLPSKIAYSTLTIKSDDGSQFNIPRRELWDVRVQLMAEEDDEGLGNLGNDDVRTGVYEGGFKSWESSVDVVKVLYQRRGEGLRFPRRILEVRCFSGRARLYTK